MAQSKEPLGFDMPEQTLAAASGYLTSAKRLEQWVQGLPRAHIGETTRQIYNMLREFNQFPVPPKQRLMSLEILQEPINYVIGALRKHVIGQSFPLTPKKQKVSHIIREVLNEAGMGYKIYLEQMINTPHIRPDAPNIILAIQSALNYGLMSFLNAYQTYTSHPKGAWLELHKLYNFAQQNHLLEIPTKSPSLRGTDTIDDTYKRILLLALVNPYQLSQEDIQRIYDSLYFWAPYCMLTAMTSRSTARSMFAVNIVSDEAPTYYAYCTVENPQCLLLDTRGLAQQLRELCYAADRSIYPAAVAALPRDVLKRMLLSWGSLSKRAFTRRDHASHVNVTLSLSGIYKYLALRHKTNIPSNTQTQAVFSSQAVIAADNNGLYPPVWDLADTNETPSIYNKASNAAAAGSQRKLIFTNSSNAAELTVSFNITNESAGGYCLLWQHNTSGTLTVGDMVCIHESAVTANQCNICVVRWMKNVQDKMVLGVEILSPCAQPAAVWIIHGDGAHGEPVGSLLLPQVDAVKRPITLLTTPTFRSGDILALNTPQGTQMVRLTHLQQATRSFKQFQFTSVEPQSRVEEATPGFDTIWTSL